MPCLLSHRLLAEAVFIGIDEKLSVVLSKTGGLESLEVQGTMTLVIGSEADAYVSITVSTSLIVGLSGSAVLGLLAVVEVLVGFCS